MTVRLARSRSPAKVAGLAHAQAVAVDHEANQPIAMAVPIAPERRQQLVHFGLGQVFTHTIGCVWFARRGHWSQNSAFDQLEVTRFHWHCPHVQAVNWSQYSINVTKVTVFRIWSQA